MESNLVSNNDEKQPFINNTQINIQQPITQQTFYSKYKNDILKLRTPLIIITYHVLGYLYTVPYLPMPSLYIFLLYIPISITLFMTYLTFYCAAYTHPGKIPLEYKSWNGSIDTKPRVPIYSQISESKIIESGYTININDKQKLYCKKCQCYRPLRAHHCSQCNDCICRMDHHCWFLNNCVGINNHRYFIQFLIYLWIILMTYQITYHISNTYILDNESYIIYCAATFMYYIGFFFELFVTGLFFTNFRCILNNQTYLEQKFLWDQMARYGYATDDKPYDKGNESDNLRDVFGSVKIAWLLPIELSEADAQERMLTNAAKCDLCPCYRNTVVVANDKIVEP
eukprot:212199_1